MMIRLAIMASGSGSNAENIVKYFAHSTEIEVAAIISNKADAYVLERAQYLHVPSYVMSRADMVGTDKLLNLLRELKTDWVILAGFLVLLPECIVNEYDGKILNIHPSLLPKFGGKGMYGDKVHQAVVEAREKESGITIHKIDANYDEGTTVFQAKIRVEPLDNAEKVAQKVHALEYKFYPQIIENLVLGRDFEKVVTVEPISKD
ncbi:MAG: phosphoribosylglycinamide formyltransferase [Salinivirgaceae bacterium]|nr:phosphoribosylglycinamide formyltransferase [Salinivirgaceae bacterium]